jgi:hypothetical protein
LDSWQGQVADFHPKKRDLSACHGSLARLAAKAAYFPFIA